MIQSCHVIAKMIENVDPNFHIRKGMLQAKEEMERQETLRKLMMERGDVALSTETEDHGWISNSHKDRMKSNTMMLMKGVFAGSSFGLLAGTVYGLRAKHASPVTLGLVSAVHLGLFAGQFVGYRYLVPQFISRSVSEQSLMELLTLPGLELPDFVRDLSEREVSLLGTFASAGAAGFTLGKLHAIDASTKFHLGKGYSNTFALRSGIVWGAIMTVGHFALMKLEDYRVNNVVKNRLKSLYGNNVSSYEGVELPPREKLVKSSAFELLRDPTRIFKEYQLEWLLDWLPLVHDEEGYKHRKFLESQSRLLEEEVLELRKEALLREQIIKKLKKL